MRIIYSTKKIAYMAVFIILGLWITSCSHQAEKSILDPEQPVTLKIWHYYNGPQKNAFDELVSEFNETVGMEQGIILETYYHASVNELKENVFRAVNQQVGAEEAPDIFAAYPDTAYELDQLGYVAELDHYFSEEELSKYITDYLDEGRIDQDGHLKIFPVAKSTEILMMNKTDWTPFALETGAKFVDLSTWEGVAKTAELYYNWTDQKTDAPNDGKAFFGRDAMANYMLIGSKQLGVDLFQVNEGNVELHLDKTVLKKLWDCFYVPYINGYYASYGKFRSDDVKTGDILAFVGATTGAAYFPEMVNKSGMESYAIDSVMLAAPVFCNGEPYAVQQGAGMVVMKSEEKVEYAASQFMKWFTAEEQNIRFCLSSGYMPVQKSSNQVKAISSYFEDEPGYSVEKQLQLALPVAIEQTNTHKLYTSKPFNGATEVRNILEVSLLQQAQGDREAVLADMQSGTPREQAVAKWNTAANFDQWYMQLYHDITTALEASHE